MVGSTSPSLHLSHIPVKLIFVSLQALIYFIITNIVKLGSPHPVTLTYNLLPRKSNNIRPEGRSSKR